LNIQSEVQIAEKKRKVEFIRKIYRKREKMGFSTKGGKRTLRHDARIMWTKEVIDRKLRL